MKYVANWNDEKKKLFLLKITFRSCGASGLRKFKNLHFTLFIVNTFLLGWWITFKVW